MTNESTSVTLQYRYSQIYEKEAKKRNRGTLFTVIIIIILTQLYEVKRQLSKCKLTYFSNCTAANRSLFVSSVSISTGGAKEGGAGAAAP